MLSLVKCVRCRFCDWSSYLWFWLEGKQRSGWDALREHVHDNHPEAVEDIRTKIAAERSLRKRGY